MKNEILPIGSIINVENVLLMIAGYHIYTAQDKMMLGYSVLSYPVGCMGEDSYGLVSVRSDYDVIFKGLVTERSSRILEHMGEIEENIDDVTPEDYEKELSNMRKILSHVSESEENLDE